MMLPHELRTPLNGILAYGEILAADPTSLSAEEIADMGQTICQSGRALERLIETFLVYSQLEMVAADKQKINVLRGKRMAVPGPMIEREAVRKADDAKRAADLQFKLAPFKFSQPGTPVRVELLTTPEAVLFSVIDRGRGFEPDQIGKVGAFLQFGRKTHEQQGLGLGLTIARRLAELHGGVLTIQSEKGVGTTVTAKLPKAG
jgi:two-component system sensor histidine kinase/response regulator